jgi:hypothetical protein
MPKLALSRRHRRQNNLVQCWNSPAPSSSSKASVDGPSDQGGIVRAAARMVSDEDMHNSCPSPLEQSSPKSLGCWSGEGRMDSGRAAEHLESPNRRKHSLKRPSPSMCLSDLAVASYSASCSSPRVRPKLSFLEPTEQSSGFSANLLVSPSSLSPPAPASPKSDPSASPYSPWGHFVDLVPPENEIMTSWAYDIGEASVPSTTCGRRGAVTHPTPTAGRRRPSTPRATTRFLPCCPRPNNAALGRCCENGSPYELALHARRRLRLDGPTGSPAASAAAGSVSSHSLSGFVLSFPPAFSSPSRPSAAAVTTSLRSLDLKPNESDLRLLMEDARTQFGNLTMKR